MMNKNIKKERVLQKILNLTYLQCPNRNHEGQVLDQICLSDSCKNSRLICSLCQQSDHSDHQTIPIKEYLLEISSVPSKSAEQCENLKYQFFECQQTIDELEVHCLSQISELKNKILSQLEDAKDHVTINFNLYRQKISGLIHYSDHESLIDTIEKHIYKSDYKKLGGIFNGCLQNNLLPISEGQTKQKWQTKNEINSKIKQVIDRLQEKVDLFKAEVKTCHQLVSKAGTASQRLNFQQINFGSEHNSYSWDPKLKGKFFSIDLVNPKKLELSTSANEQRFALMEMDIKSSSKSVYKWGIKISKLSGWIGVGMCLKNVIKSVNFKFAYSTLLHGSYMISNNGFSWSHHDAKYNSVSKGFTFKSGDTVLMKYDSISKELSFKKMGPLSQPTIKLSVQQYSSSESITPCVNMCSAKDAVEIVPFPQNFSEI